MGNRAEDAPPPPAGLGPRVPCQRWLCFSFTPGRTNANPVWLCRPQRTSLALGTRLGRERAGDPVPEAGWEDGGVPSVLSPPGDGHQGAPKTLERLFSLDIENHSCCLPLGSDIGLEMHLFSVVIKVIEPTFIYLDYPGTVDIKDN